MLNPNDDEKKDLKKLRDKIMNSKLFSTYPIPVSWFLLEQDILRFAEERNANLVLVKDCVKIAAKLLINPEALEVALLYFHSLNVFLYSPEVLHGLVFIDPQFPLHCVFEFVAFQFKLTHGLEEAVNAADVFDIEKGIVTMEMMKKECFSKCFVPKLYGPEQAIKLFQNLFIAALLGSGKYLMPFLLSMMPKTELPKYVPTSFFPAPLLILFKNKSASNVSRLWRLLLFLTECFVGLWLISSLKTTGSSALRRWMTMMRMKRMMTLPNV